jgi:hypothetical protein
MKTVIVHGPRACGKTRNAARIAAYFGIDTIVDDWDERRHEITIGAIHLTNEPVRKTSFRCVNFADLQLPAAGLIGTKKVAPATSTNLKRSNGRRRAVRHDRGPRRTLVRRQRRKDRTRPHGGRQYRRHQHLVAIIAAALSRAAPRRLSTARSAPPSVAARAPSAKARSSATRACANTSGTSSPSASPPWTMATMASPSRPGVHDEPHHHRSPGNGDIQLAITSDRQDATSTCNRIITGMPKRTAKALAHRILHEIEFAEGKRQRRPTRPTSRSRNCCPAWTAAAETPRPAGRSGRPCPLNRKDQQHELRRILTGAAIGAATAIAFRSFVIWALPGNGTGTPTATWSARSPGQHAPARCSARSALSPTEAGHERTRPHRLRA